jgi:hypothetical protein
MVRMVTSFTASLHDRPVGTYRALPSPAGGFQIEITLWHAGSAPLVDFYQLTSADHEPTLLHPDEGPSPFRPCPSSGAPGWTSLGSGLVPGEVAGPFVAWCAQPPAAFAMRWCAEDSEVGGVFEISSEPASQFAAA